MIARTISKSSTPPPDPDPAAGPDCEPKLGCGDADVLEVVVYEMPVPGIPTVVLTPRLEKFTVAPRRPTEREAPRFPRLSRTPGISLTDRRILNPITGHI